MADASFIPFQLEAGPMPRVDATFTGSVIAVHVWAGGEEIPLVFDGTKWVGARDIAAMPMVVRMRFIAIPFTDWALVVKRSAKKVVDESGQSTEQIVDKFWVVNAGEAILVQDSEGRARTVRVARRAAAKERPRSRGH